MRLGQVGQTRSATPVNATRGVQTSKTVSEHSDEPEFAIEDEAPASLINLEKEASASRFPGIAEGLTPSYLWVSERPGREGYNPSTPVLLAPSLDDCSDFIHLEKRFLECLMDGLAPTPASQSLRWLTRRADLMQTFPTAIEWGNSEVRLGKLQEFLVLVGLPPQGEHVYELEEAVHGRKAFFGLFEEVARSFSMCSYLCRKVGQAKSVLNGLWSEGFRDLKMRLRVQSDSKNNAGYEWVQGEARLTLCLDSDSSTDPSDLEQQWTTGVFGGEQQLRRGHLDLISMIHEYAHAHMDALWGTPVAADPAMVGRALSEGFAVLTELLSLDLLLVSGTGSPDFLERRRQRVEWLQQPLYQTGLEERMPYLEGVELFASVFRASGFGGVQRYLAALDPSLCNRMFRSDQKYQSAIPDISEIAALVSRR